MTRDPSPTKASQAKAKPGGGSSSDTDPIRVVGIGPGNTDLLTGQGRQAIGQADVIVGFETVVEFVEALTDAELLKCKYSNELETLEQFADRVAAGATGVAVLMGDPNVSSAQFLHKVEEAIDRPVRVIPGISSIQVAASRVRTPLEDSTFVTLHKRGSLDADFQRLVQDAEDRHLLILPRPYDWMPGDIAAALIDRGVSDALDAFVLEQLTLDGESIHQSSLRKLAREAGGENPEDTPFSDLSVLVIHRQE